MIDPFESAIRQYAELPRALHADARFYMSRDTADALRRRSASYINGPVPISTMLGIPVLIDDSLSLGVVELRHESPIARALRQAVDEGFWAFTPLPQPPKPTLCALLRHWAKKWRK